MSKPTTKEATRSDLDCIKAELVLENNALVAAKKRSDHDMIRRVGKKVKRLTLKLKKMEAHLLTFK